MRCSLLVLLLAVLPLHGGEPTLVVRSPMSPPAWALLERELLKANAAACKEFYEHFFDERGYLRCVERWGGDDGPDDAIENCTDWPLVHALGGSDEVLKLYKKAWEGHLRQYTAAKTTHVPFAKDGMYYKEFPVMFDWLHNGEGLTVFNLQGLSDPHDRLFRQRTRRFAGFYMNEDPGAPNYDPQHKIIKSMFNGSRGPLLRKATAVDWAGDPVEIENRFRPGHGERNYQQMLDHFKDYNDIVGDHPLNLQATSLAVNAYLMTGEKKYRDWVLEYVEAWRERMIANGNIIPTKVGLDGKVDRWYDGVYGWAFSVKVPQSGETAHRNLHGRGFIGFMNAYFLTGGDDRWLEPWRKQADVINAQKKTIDRQEQYPTMYNEKGWYAYGPGKYRQNAKEIWYLSLKDEDRKRIPDDPCARYWEGGNVQYPETALRRDLEQVRRRIEAMRQDKTTPDTRMADDPGPYNPASVTSLIELMLGGIWPAKTGSILHCRLRYFDEAKKRAGIPDDVGALVETLRGDRVTLTLVNLNQLEERLVIVQGGAYAEHHIESVLLGERSLKVAGSWFRVRLAPGTGIRVVIETKRYANRPTMAFPWDR